MNNILTNELYTFTRCEANRVSVVLSDASHPVFKAHFENYPVLPAFLQVDIASEILKFEVKGISRSKFIEPLFPEDTLVMEYEERPSNLRIRWKKNDKIASEITLEIR
jgi:3-hydroxyacyl-[acyl-carrier-protein] dehydratase